jgi:DNA-binding transcriptional LysR family regulator
MNVELRHLRAFAAVASHRSFTAASRELLVTQSALTRTIQQLELEIGVQLFVRTTRHVELTPAGQAFLNHILVVLSELDRALDSIRGQQVLRVGFQWLLPDPWATDTISEFERVTGVSVILLRHDDLGTHLQSGGIDLDVTRIRLSLAGVVHTTLFEEDRVAVVSARSPLADREVIDWLELAREPIVVNTVSGTTRPELWPASHRPQRIVTCGNYDEWLELVVTGHGAGTLPESAARTATHPGLRFVALTGAPSVAVWLAYQPRRLNPWGRRFLTVAIAVRNRLVPSRA